MDVKDLTDQFESYQNYTLESRLESERDIKYENHHQWSDADREILESRGQAPVVINRIKVKVNLLTGIQTKSRTAPRALPRTPQHTDGADAVTEALRYVTDNTRFKIKSSACFKDQVVPGYGGGIIEIEDHGGEKSVAFNRIPWDRYYYDPHSRELDFSDKKFDGIVIWMDKEDAIEDFPQKKDDIDHLISGSPEGGDETFDDKPILWYDRKRKRIRVCQHFWKEKGVWMMAFISQDIFLTEPKESPYKDEFGKPCNPIEMQTAYIDDDLNRYGEVRSYIWLQDEINHRRSRLLYAGSVSRTMGEDGAVDDVNQMKQELAKANGHVKYNKGFEFQILPNDAISETQLLLYQESKSEIDNLGANQALAGRSNARSGRQEQIQQAGGITELATIYDGHKDWENRVYRQMWNRVRQIWTREKWIRVTDDESNLQWVGLNIPVTNGELMMQAAQDPSNPQVAAQAQQMLQSMVGDPRLAEIAEVKNNVTELDVDIIITESPDIPTLRQETVEGLLKLAERYGPESVPFSVALELSDLPNKDTVKKMLNPEIPPEVQEQQRAVQELMFNLDVEDKKATIAEKQAKAENLAQEAEAQEIENEIVKSGFPNLVADRNADTEKKMIENAQKQIETIKLAEEPTESVNVNV
jgi:hypothetical protein